MKHFIILVTLALSAIVFCVWKAEQPVGKKPDPFAVPDQDNKDNSRSQYYAPRKYASILHQVNATGAATNAEAASGLQTRLEHVFDKRYDQYQANLETLNKYLWYQLILLVTAFVAVFKKSPSFKVPIVETEVPVRWVYLALPACLVYLWLCFGFKLNELIDARIVLWKITEAMQAPNSAFGGTDPQATVEWRRALYTFSLNPAVYDSGFMDGWFVMFRPQYTLLGQPQPMGYVIMALFGVFLGMSNGTALGLVLHGRKRFAGHKEYGWLAVDYFWVAAALLGLSHWFFWARGDHPNWQQPVILVVACVVTGWLMTRPWHDATDEKPSGDGTGNGFMMLLVNQQHSATIEKGEPAPTSGVPKDYPDAKQLVTEDCIKPPVV